MKSVAGRVSCSREGGTGRISCDRKRRGCVTAATSNCLFGGAADCDDSLSRVSPCVEPGNISLWKLVETSHRKCRKVRMGHLACERPETRGDEQRPVHRATGFTQVDELPASKRHHLIAPIRTASSLTESFIEIRSVLAR